jgi:hypothetical protein
MVLAECEVEIVQLHCKLAERGLSREAIGGDIWERFCSAFIILSLLYCGIVDTSTSTDRICLNTPVQNSEIWFSRLWEFGPWSLGYDAVCVVLWDFLDSPVSRSILAGVHTALKMSCETRRLELKSCYPCSGPVSSSVWQKLWIRVNWWSNTVPIIC